MEGDSHQHELCLHPVAMIIHRRGVKANGQRHLPGAVDEQMLDDLDRHRSEATVVSIGGGLASLTLVGLLRLGGLPPDEIAVLAEHASPVEAERHAAGDARPLGVTASGPWGAPTQAVRDALHQASPRRVAKAIGNPLAAEVFVPRDGDVEASIDVEAHRIGWRHMVVPAGVEWVRPHVDGGFVVAATMGSRHHLWRARHLHLALGVRHAALSAPAAEFVLAHPGDERVVEASSDAWRHLGAAPLVVAVDGRGRRADYVIDALLDDKARGMNAAQILHVSGPGAPVDTTPDGGAELSRPPWLERKLFRASKRGCYVRIAGDVTAVRPRSQRLRLDVASYGGGLPLLADRLVDASQADRPAAPPPLAELFALADDHARPTVPPIGDDRIVAALSTDRGLCYASGAHGAGPPSEGADPFLALQLDAMAIADDLARRGTIEPLTRLRALRAWMSWARSTPP